MPDWFYAREVVSSWLFNLTPRGLWELWRWLHKPPVVGLTGRNGNRFWVRIRDISAVEDNKKDGTTDVHLVDGTVLVVVEDPVWLAETVVGTRV